MAEPGPPPPLNPRGGYFAAVAANRLLRSMDDVDRFVDVSNQIRETKQKLRHLLETRAAMDTRAHLVQEKK